MFEDSGDQSEERPSWLARIRAAAFYVEAGIILLLLLASYYFAAHTIWGWFTEPAAVTAPTAPEADPAADAR